MPASLHRNLKLNPPRVFTYCDQESKGQPTEEYGVWSYTGAPRSTALFIACRFSEFCEKRVTPAGQGVDLVGFDWQRPRRQVDVS